jgi:hypothetical protein
MWLMIFTGPTTAPHSLVHPRFAPEAIFGAAFEAAYGTGHANVDLHCIAYSQEHVVVSQIFEQNRDYKSQQCSLFASCVDFRQWWAKDRRIAMCARTPDPARIR